VESGDLSHFHTGEAGEFLAEVLAQMTEGVATLTEEGRVVSWNPPAAQMTGYTLAEVNQRGFGYLFDPHTAMFDLIQHALHGTPVDEKLVLTHADGHHIVVGARCFPLRHLQQSLGRVVVVLRDLSELEALHNQLVQNERLSMLGRLAGAVSHEIRNPLTAIFLQADILEEELQQPAGGDRTQITRSLHVIKEEVARLHDVVQQYLSLARLTDLQRQPVDFGLYLEHFGAEMREQLAARGITLRFEYVTSLGQVALHPNSFRRVLLNLVHNAVEAMPDGGELTFRGRRDSSRVCLELRDTGCGIPPDQLPLLFSPLHTTKAEGTGLGLYLVREIIAAHDGQIAVSSTPGVGTTFRLILPVCDPDQAARS
jgi:two-component system sensor histidine kinase AtoS